MKNEFLKKCSASRVNKDRKIFCSHRSLLLKSWEGRREEKDDVNRRWERSKRLRFDAFIKNLTAAINNQFYGRSSGSSLFLLFLGREVTVDCEWRKDWSRVSLVSRLMRKQTKQSVFVISFQRFSLMTQQTSLFHVSWLYVCLLSILMASSLLSRFYGLTWNKYLFSRSAQTNYDL